jgi:hypothetical protein
MAGRIPLYSRFPGTNFTTYTITLTTDGNNNYFYQWQRTNSAPATTDEDVNKSVESFWSGS